MRWVPRKPRERRLETPAISTWLGRPAGMRNNVMRFASPATSFRNSEHPSSGYFQHGFNREYTKSARNSHSARGAMALLVGAQRAQSQ
jgi:hypothetical protein